MRLLTVLALLIAGAVPAFGATPAPAIARIHGTITRIDPVRRTFWINHAPFAMMPMSMTMEVEPVHHADLRTLHVGERVSVTVDTTVDPWPGTNIQPLH